MFFFPLVMPNILATLNTKAVTDLDCGSRCNKAVTTLARRFGSSMENQRLPALSMMIEELHSGIVTKHAMCSCLELCVFGLPCTQCRVLGMAGIGIVDLTIHSVSCAWYGESCRYQVTRQCKHRQDWRPPRPTKLEYHTHPWYLALGWRYMLCPFWGLSFLLHHVSLVPLDQGLGVTLGLCN